MTLKTPKEMASDLAERFRGVRKAKGISIKNLSEASGVPYSTIRRFEKTGEISLVSFVKLVSAIGEDREIIRLFADYRPSSIEEVLRANR